MDSLIFIKQVIDIFTALLSPIIAISVAYIAYQQWKLNVAKEKRDLKSDRLKIYQSTQRLLRGIDNTHKVDLKVYEDFQESVALADFYFDEGVVDWLHNVDMEVSCWLNNLEIIDAQEYELKESALAFCGPQIKKSIDALQDYHCQLLSVFKEHLQ
ncbi:hypothetical protein [Pseudoalteromonas luteoviolacea]|uniref:hypothetical protein n=1 Tax=Pseudoalteromonas luteoviolacea TaxID=43657 RepID=UPI001B372D0E|nr:hypothetical protein [Pseudoalteromonas luteoviolacea]MBQ4836021.1 hypothetical protein [Pseudoalteromonas luteoviolacea]